MTLVPAIAAIHPASSPNAGGLNRLFMSTACRDTMNVRARVACLPATSNVKVEGS
jgi:hypothetical protein